MYITVGCYRSTAAHPYILGAFDNLKTPHAVITKSTHLKILVQKM